MDEQQRKWAGDALVSLAERFRAGVLLAHAKQEGPKPEGLVEVDELVAFADVDPATLPPKWAAWAEALAPVAYAGGLVSLDISWRRDPAGPRDAPSAARVTLVFAPPAPWAPPGDLPLLGVIDTRSERWKAAEARYAASQSPEDLAIITEEQEAFDRAERIAAFLGLGEMWPTPDVLRKLVEAADRLFDRHDHDGDGWEMIDTARKLGRARLVAWDAGEAESYQPRGFPTLEAEVIHLRQQGERLLERARSAESRQAQAERAAESLSRGLAGAMKALREGAAAAGPTLASLGLAAMMREAMAQSMVGNEAARPLMVPEDRQPTMDEARAAAGRLSRARDGLRAKLAGHGAVGSIYLRSVIVEFLGDLAAPGEVAVEADVLVPEPGRIEIRVRASNGTAELLQRILAETLPSDYSVGVVPR